MRDLKRIIVNFKYLALIQALNIFIPIMTLPHLSKTIGLEGIGQIALANSIAFIAILFIDWGFNSAGARKGAKYSKNDIKLSLILSRISIFKLFCISGFLTLGILINALLQGGSVGQLVLLQFIALSVNSLVPMWLYQGIERNKSVAVFVLLGKLAYVIPLLFFIHSPSQVVLVVFFLVAGNMVTLVGVWIHLIFVLRLSIFKQSIYKIILEIKDARFIFFSSLLGFSYTHLPVIVLGANVPSEILGIFSVGQKLCALFVSFFQSLGQATFPLLVNSVRKKSPVRSARYAFNYLWLTQLLAVFMAVMSYFLLGLIIKFLNLNGTSGIEEKLTWWLIVSVIIVYAVNSNLVILSLGLDKMLFRMYIAVSIISACNTLLLIPSYGYSGAMVSVAAAEILIGLRSSTIIRKGFKHHAA